VCKSNVYCCNIFREEKICGSLLRQNNKVHAGSSVQFSSVQFSNFYNGLSDKHHHKDLVLIIHYMCSKYN